MARTSQQIKDEMTFKFMSDPTLATLYGFDVDSSFSSNFSLLSLENILFEIVSYSMHWVELLFDQHKKEIDDRLLNQKNARLPWYVFMARSFQYGFDLFPDKDYFNNGSATQEQIDQSKIIKYAAVEESDSGRVILKIAGITDDELAPIDQLQIDAVEEYFKEVRPAGVKLNVINYEPDKMFLNLTVIRNPLIIDENGMNILDGSFPIKDAIASYIRDLPFNGEFVIAHFVEFLMDIEGVEIVHANNIQTSWIDPITQDYGDPENIYIRTIPVSGYFKVQNDGLYEEINGGINYVV